ncbi:tyrosine-type recombinase/integrase [Streptosporangium sp. NPDC049046]|uniref:tyrosine-type recombinase/integrase n=1 Tax=Streptosporangium sp. NPDC049046 TaxID=3155031 RepID=UPI00342DF03E
MSNKQLILVSADAVGPSLEAYARLKSDLPQEWHGSIIGPGIDDWDMRSAKSQKIDLSDLPEHFRIELAWMAHWQYLDGMQVVSYYINAMARMLRWASQQGHENLPISLALWKEEDSRRLYTTFQQATTGSPAAASTLKLLHSCLRHAQLALAARLHDGVWWQLDRWHPRCDPRIPLREREPQSTESCSPGQIHLPWLREAAKWVLGTLVQSGAFSWSTLLSVRMPALLRFDDWLRTLPDPGVIAGDLRQASSLAAAFRLWDSVPANRTRDGRRPRTDRVDPIKVNNDLLAIAEFMSFLIDNREEALRTLGPTLWDRLDPAHPAAWARQVQRKPARAPVLEESQYVDDHALAQITAYLPVLGAAEDEMVTVTVNGRQHMLAGQGEPQVMRMLLLQILTGRRAGEILSCEFGCLSPATNRVMQAAEGEQVARFQYAQSKIGKAPDTILVDAEVVALIHEQQDWVRRQLGAPTRYLFPKRKANAGGTKAFPRGSYNQILVAFSDLAQISDSTGRPVHLSHTHRFRHTRLTRLAELGLPIHVLQRYAGHANPTMSMHYVARRDEHAEQAFVATRRFKADGSLVTFTREDHDGMQLFDRADRFLPNGFCLLPPLQKCDKGNACLTCGVFVTDDSHTALLERQLSDTSALIERTTAAFKDRHGVPMPADNVWLIQRTAERDALVKLLSAMAAAPGRAVQGAGSPTAGPVPVTIDTIRYRRSAL